MEQPAIAAPPNPWPERRDRVAALWDRYPFAREMLRLYGALVDVQARAFQAARADAPDPAELSDYVAHHALPGVVDATLLAGPETLARHAVAYRSADFAGIVAAWLGDAELSPVDRYYARAAAGPVLEALGPAVGLLCTGPRDRRHCPTCGGAPQLSYYGVSGEALVTPQRYLLCSRCSHSWPFARLTCPGCGESATARLPIFGEGEHFPHVRIDACESCERYLLTFDPRKDSRCVPLVDELAALPLDLYARERGLSKIVPNLMGV